MKCYFDGSEGTDDSGGKWLTLAGYAAPDSFWGAFSRKWERMLTERYPIAPFIHMWQVVSGEDPFERRSGWDEENINRLILNAVDLMQQMDKRRFRCFVCSVDISARQRLLREGYEV